MTEGDSRIKTAAAHLQKQLEQYNEQIGLQVQGAVNAPALRRYRAYLQTHGMRLPLVAAKVARHKIKTARYRQLPRQSDGAIDPQRVLQQVKDRL